MPYFLLVILYIVLNMFVTRRINKSYYISEAMRSLHKKFIWLFPFLGPLIIVNFWKKPKRPIIQTNTKAQRDKNSSYNGFYESGKGVDD